MLYKPNNHAMLEKLITGFNNIYINLVPSKIVQWRANFIQYKNQEIIDQKQKTRLCFKNAVNSNSYVDLEELEASKYKLWFLWDKAEKSYYSKELLNLCKVWNFIKTVTGGGKMYIPSTTIDAFPFRRQQRLHPSCISLGILKYKKSG